MDISSRSATIQSDLFRDARQTTLKSLNISGMAVDGAVKQQVFKAFDADQDGLVSAEELAKLGNNDPANPAKLADGQSMVSVFDRNGDGALDQREFGASRLLDGQNLKTLLGVQDEAGVIGWLVSRADTDGDGALSADEYATVAAPTRAGRIDADGKAVPEAQEETNARDFGRIDADQDGRLSAEELAESLRTGPRLIQFGDNAKATNALAARNDTDGDGALSLDELSGAATAAGLASTHVAELLKAADGDGDAKLSTDELAAAAARDPRLYKLTPLGATYTPPSGGDLLLSRLLRATVNSLSDQWASDLGGALNRTA